MVHFSDDRSNQHLRELRLRGEEDLMRSLAPQYGLPFIDLQGITINPDALIKIPEATARKANLIAFALNRTSLSVATNSPQNATTVATLHDLEAKGFTINLHLSSERSLAHGFTRYADQKNTTASKRGVLDIDPDQILRHTTTFKSLADVKHALDTITTINSPRRISETLELMFAGALALSGSDIHIEPAENGIRLRYRLDGILHDVTGIDNHLYGRLMSRLKLLAGMTLNEKKEAQDGRFQFVFGEREIEVRASIIPGAGGESMVMRLLDPGVASFSIEKLQLNPYLKRVMEEELRRPNGLVITTGPTGSGKTTALYAFLRSVHDSAKKIITIENPVEYKLSGIVQTQTGPDYTFASGLRAILRQDPDIIMVGEIRDREVAETAIHAAQTGHLVFSTLHTNSAAGGFPRLIDLGVDARMIGSSVNILIGQRLVRLLCPACRSTRAATQDEVTLFRAALRRYPEPVTIPDQLTLPVAVGCAACGHTGYKGRVGVFEAIIVDEAVEEVVIRDPREHMILEAALPQQIPSMAEDGLIKVLNGITTLDEVERAVDLATVRRHYAPPTSATTTTPAAPDDFTRHIIS